MTPGRFWLWTVGGFAAWFAITDARRAQGPADGDTFSEVFGSALNTPAKRAAFRIGWEIFADWFPEHILKERN